MKTKFIENKLSEAQIEGISPLEPSLYFKVLKIMARGEGITLINIICPGYKKKRERGVEEFDFPRLSSDVCECPNVILMIEKMNSLIKVIKKLGYAKNVGIKLILADVAILNYRKLKKKQDVKKTMDRFYESIKKYVGRHNEIELLKMSELSFEFKRIPISGIEPKYADSMYRKVRVDTRKKADEYVGSLIFERTNQLMSGGVYSKACNVEIIKRSKREVKRFLAEYGLAGCAIKKLYKNPVVLFTEPSGYIRGYFYNAFLKGENKLPVLYLC